MSSQILQSRVMKYSLTDRWAKPDHCSQLLKDSSLRAKDGGVCKRKSKGAGALQYGDIVHLDLRLYVPPR